MTRLITARPISENRTNAKCHDVCFRAAVGLIADVTQISLGTLLTVTNRSTNQSISLNLAGDFTNATWTFSKDGTGGTLVVDPPAPTSTNDGPPGLDHVVALFNQHIAAGFPDNNGTPITNQLSQTVANQEQFLAQPYRGSPVTPPHACSITALTAAIIASPRPR
jgi:hypothetical protein